MTGNGGQKIKRILGIDGKTQRGNTANGRKPNHIVSVVDDNGFCLGQVKTEVKSNEIHIEGHIVTSDAMGCQTDIAALIRHKKADYMLALKKNQGTLYNDVQLYFSDPDLLKKYHPVKTDNKARSSIEIREYWQTDDIAWLPQKRSWSGLRTIVMTRNTITKNDETTTEIRYFISSLPLDIEEAAWAIRGHWMIESYHWHLDVTFREDANHTLDKDAAFNLNIISKIALNTLKLLETGIRRISLKGKRFIINMNPAKYLDQILEGI